MPIDYIANTASFTDVCEIELAENLLGWILNNPEASLDLSRCTHLHSAVLQVLMALKPEIAQWPNDEKFSNLLKNCISREEV